MRSVLWVMVGIDQLFMLLVGAVRLGKFELSEFAFKERLAHQTGQEARLQRQLHRLLPEVKVLQKVELVIAASLSVTLLTLLEKPLFGTLYALMLFLFIRLVARLRFIENTAERLFRSSLPLVLEVTSRLRFLWVIIGVAEAKQVVAISSQAEFVDQLRRLPSTVLTPLQRQRLETVLSSETKTVKEIMTPKKRITVVEPSATLGPVVLTDLQKTGHGYFPVATKKSEPVGILALSDVADIHTAKDRSIVRELMNEQIAWVHQDMPLYEVANVFLTEKAYLLLVKDDANQWCGLVTVADLMKHLLGIVKE